MSILVTKKIKKTLRLRADIWLFIAVFLGLTGRIYEYFSHGVISYSMIYAFAYPLLLGCFVRVLLIKLPIYLMPGDLTDSVYNFGIVTLMLGSFLEGVFDIYGTVSKYVKYYYMVGAGLAVLALILFIIGLFKAQREW